MSTVAIRRVLRRDRPEAAGLSSHLRRATGRAHDAAQTSFALDARLESCAAYADLLLRLREFYGPVEAALLAVAGWRRLTPAVDVRARCRAALLDDDLRSLGIAIPGEQAASAPFAIPSFAHGLGCLYVIEGSALGGRIVARRAQVALGGDLPVSFFSSAGRADLGAEWRSLQAALDAYGAAHAAAARRAVVAGARATFSALGARLDDARLTP